MTSSNASYDRVVDAKNPQHYRKGGTELIDIVELLNFNRGNAVKYLVRAGDKGGKVKELEDLEKAGWYIEREIARVKRRDEGR